MTVAAANEDEGRYGRIDATITNLAKDEVDELNLPISRAPCAVPADTTTVEHKRAHITSATSTSGISAPGLPRRLGISPRRIRTKEFPGDKDHRHAPHSTTANNTDVDSRPADVLHIIPDTNFVIRVKVSQSAGTTRARPSATRCATSGRCTPPPSSRAPRARRPRRCPRPPAARGDPEDAAALESGASLADDDKASGGGGGRGGGRAAGGGSGKSEAEHAQQLEAEGFALDDGGDGGDDGLGGGRDDDDAELLGGILHESRRERLAREKEDRLRGGNGGDGHPAPAAAVPLLTRALRHGDFDFGTVAAALARTPAPYAFHDSRLALALHY